jgi:hypothetical protein
VSTYNDHHYRSFVHVVSRRGFKPTVRSDPSAPPAPKAEESEDNAAGDLQPTEDIQIVLAKEQRKREKAERKAEKEKKRAEKEQRRAAREERRKERREREESDRHHIHGSRPHHEDRSRYRSLSRSRSPPLGRRYGDRRDEYTRSPSLSRSPPPYRRDHGQHTSHYGKPLSRSISPRRESDYPDSRMRTRRFSPPPRGISLHRADEYGRHRDGAHSPRPRGNTLHSRSPRREEFYPDRREAYVSPPRRRRDSPPIRRHFESPPGRSRSLSPRPIIRA